MIARAKKMEKVCGGNVGFIFGWRSIRIPAADAPRPAPLESVLYSVVHRSLRMSDGERRAQTAKRLWKLGQDMHAHGRAWQKAGTGCQALAEQVDPIEPLQSTDPCPALLAHQKKLVAIVATDQQLLQSFTEEIAAQGC
jgi:hypothetical protein